METSSSGEHSSVGLESLFRKYRELVAQVSPGVRGEERAVFPGWLYPGVSPEEEAAFRFPWAFRVDTYEIYFPSKQALAAHVYDLARFSGDISPEISFDVFRRDVQGFHYSMKQVLAWVEHRGTTGSFSGEEKALLDRLVEDGALSRSREGYASSGRARHVLGAVAGNKRSFALNLNHERLHVLWDEDEAFRRTWIDKWRGLTDSRRQEVRGRLKGYRSTDEMLLMEEWTVRSNETNPLPSSR